MRIKFCLLDADCIEQEGKTVIRLFGKSVDGKSVCILDKAEPYFFVQPATQEVEKLKKLIISTCAAKNLEIKRIEIAELKLFGKMQKFLKIVARTPAIVHNIREVVKKFEPDLVIEEYGHADPFVRSYLIDKNFLPTSWLEVRGDKIELELRVDVVVQADEIVPTDEAELVKPNILALDIECVYEGGQNKIIMASVVGDNYKRVLTYGAGKYPDYVKVLKDERELLQHLIQTINRRNPDLLLGYNTDDFDFPILRERCDAFKLKLKISKDGSCMRLVRRGRSRTAKLRGIVHLDMYKFINNILAPELGAEVLDLGSVCEELLGEGKMDLGFKDVEVVWKNNPTLLAEYCLRDSQLVLKLGDLLLPQIFEIARLVGQLPFDISRMTYGQLVEWYLIRRARKFGELAPNRPITQVIQERRKLSPYAGAFVKEPVVGMHKNIIVFDFRSLYPSIIVTFNISPDTLNCECCKGDGYKAPELNYWFCKKRKGFIPTVIKDLVEKRRKIKKKIAELKKACRETLTAMNNRQYALKIIANAMYGYQGFFGARWYCREAAEACAAFGRRYIKKVIKWAEKAGFAVIYADTDSCFVKGEKKKAPGFLRYVNKKLPGIMELELQGVYPKGLFIPRRIGAAVAKKRYALADERGNITIRGLEVVRRDWCAAAKDLQHRLLEIVLLEEDVKKAVKLTHEIIKKIRTRKIDLADLTIREQLIRPIETYDVKSPHVVAAQKLIQRGHPIGPGSLISFIITKGQGSISDRAEPALDVSAEEVDVDYYVNNQIIPAAMRVLRVLGVEEEEFTRKEVGLKKFLK